MTPYSERGQHVRDLVDMLCRTTTIVQMEAERRKGQGRDASHLEAMAAQADALLKRAAA